MATAVFVLFLISGYRSKSFHHASQTKHCDRNQSKRTHRHVFLYHSSGETIQKRAHYGGADDEEEVEFERRFHWD